jgi:hypothetical protein
LAARQHGNQSPAFLGLAIEATAQIANRPAKREGEGQPATDPGGFVASNP